MSFAYQQLPNERAAFKLLSEGAKYWKLYRFTSANITSDDKVLPIYQFQETPETPDPIAPLESFLEFYPNGAAFSLVYQRSNGSNKHQINFRYDGGTPQGLQLQQNQFAGIGSPYAGAFGISDVERLVSERETKLAAEFERKLKEAEEKRVLQTKIEDLQRQISEQKRGGGQYDEIIGKVMEMVLNQYQTPTPTPTAPISGGETSNDAQTRLEKGMEILQTKLGDAGLVAGVEKLASLDPAKLNMLLNMEI